MKAQKNTYENKEARQIILAAFMFIFGFSFLIYQKQKGSIYEDQKTLTSYAQGASQFSKETLEGIDRELKSTDIRVRYNKAYIVQETARTAPQVSEKDISGEVGLKDVHSLNNRRSTREADIVREQRADEARMDRRALTPEERIAEKIARDEWAVEYDQAYQEAYVKAFIDNARKDGLDIKLNKNLDVVDINPTVVDQPMRFPQSVRDSSSNH